MFSGTEDSEQKENGSPTLAPSSSSTSRNWQRTVTRIFKTIYTIEQYFEYINTSYILRSERARGRGSNWGVGGPQAQNIKGLYVFKMSQIEHQNDLNIITLSLKYSPALRAWMWPPLVSGGSYCLEAVAAHVLST